MARPMKDSGIEWIGKIPKDWKVTKIKNHFSVISGATPRSENSSYWDGDISWITPADYKTKDKFVSSGRKSITQEGYDSCGTTLVPAGSIIFSKRAPVGTVALAKNELCTNQGCLSCVPKENTNSLFYYYTMSVFTEQFELVSTGTTFKEIGADTFSNFYLPSPSFSEQTHIADFLDAKCTEIDGVIEKTRASIEEYKKLKQSVITQAVTKGIRPNRPMKPSGIDWIGDIPEDWDISRIKHVSIFQPSCDSSKLNEDSVITYTPMECIKNGFFINNTSTYGKVAASLTPYEEGDIVIAKVTPCFENGNIAIMENLASGFGLGSSELFVIRPIKMATRYLFYWLQNQSFMQQACATMTGTGGLKRVSPYFMKNCPVTFPSQEEQKEIADYLDQKIAEIDGLIDRKEQFISEMEGYKKSLIYEYVTGKKDIPSYQRNERKKYHE